MKQSANKKTLLEEARELFNNNHLRELSKATKASKPTVSKILNDVNVGHPLFTVIAQTIEAKREEIRKNQEWLNNQAGIAA
jgi:hypothetical protein